MSDPKQVVEQIASEADATADQPMPPGAVSTRPNKSVTVATRLSPEDVAEIERLAGRLDVPPSSLIRGWILSGLNAHKDETVRHHRERHAVTGLHAQAIADLLGYGGLSLACKCGIGAHDNSPLSLQISLYKES